MQRTVYFSKSNYTFPLARAVTSETPVFFSIDLQLHWQFMECSVVSVYLCSVLRPHWPVRSLMICNQTTEAWLGFDLGRFLKMTVFLFTFSLGRVFSIKDLGEFYRPKEKHESAADTLHCTGFP